MSQSDFASTCGNIVEADEPPSSRLTQQKAHESDCPTDPPLQNSSQMESIQQGHHHQLPRQQNDRSDITQELSGWLLAIVALCIIRSFQALYSMPAFFRVLHELILFAEKEGMTTKPELTFIIGFLAFASWMLGVVFIYMFIKKNRRFFQTFLISEVLYIVCIAVTILNFLYIFHDSHFLTTSKLAGIISLSVFVMVVLSLYFVSSKKVAKYMGSDDYLKVNPFVKHSNRNPKDNVEQKTTSETTPSSPEQCCSVAPDGK